MSARRAFARDVVRGVVGVWALAATAVVGYAFGWYAFTGGAAWAAVAAGPDAPRATRACDMRGEPMGATFCPGASLDTSQVIAGASTGGAR